MIGSWIGGNLLDSLAGMTTMAAISPCSFCKENTKYSCILCGTSACLRKECSVYEFEEDTPGWKQFKKVGYCLNCRPSVELQIEDPDEEVTRLDESNEKKSRLNKRDMDTAGARGIYGCSSQSSAQETPHQQNNGNGKRSGRKWHECEISDMVDVITSSEEFTRYLIFTNTKKHKNTEVYESVLAQLNGRYKAVHGKEFPYKVDQLRNKFKWCVSVCKKACLTIKSATGNNNTVIAIIVIV